MIKRLVVFITVLAIMTLAVLPIMAGCSEPAAEAPAAPAAPVAPAPSAPSPAPAPAPSPAPAPAPAPAPTETKWWEEKWGEPQYGGKVSIVVKMLGDTFDPAYPFTSNYQPYEMLIMPDLTIDREVWSYKVGGFAPNYVGQLAESWEWEDAQTLVVNLRQGVKWHDKQPTYGREFTADDVVYSYDRVLGTGSGFTEPNPMIAMSIEPVANVTKRDTYTVAVNFKEATPLANWWAIINAMAGPNLIIPHELVESDTSDWHNAAGTGAFMVTDFISGNSITYSRNPDYYLYDERYPENRLPYLDEVKLSYIMDPSTQLAALRSGQIDINFNIPWGTVENLKKTNPEINVFSKPSFGVTFDMRLDREPFDDIRVRKALQLAIDIPTIAETHFGGYPSSNPPSLLSPDYRGWTRPYEEWPEDLKQEYVYDPDRARQLLAEAGYPDGFETNVCAQTFDDQDLLQILKAYFADIGVDMTINLMDRNQHIPFIQSGKHDQMYTVLAGCNIVNPPDVACYNYTTLYPSHRIYAPAEDAAYFDGLYLELMASEDEAKAKELVLQMEEFIYRQHWTIVNTGTVGFDASRPRLKGYLGEDIATYPGPWFWARFWVVD